MASSALAAAVIALQLAQAAPAAPGPAPARLIALGDHVKVRATPTADGELRGYLFRNMVVEVLERSAQPESVGGKQDYWYRVSRGSLIGWSFGGFFSATVPQKAIDTYDLPDVDRWWGDRFGWSTEYLETGLPRETLGKLEMDDYRGLIAMATSPRSGEYGVIAWVGMRDTLYPFLKKHAEDPKWRYFQEKLWDPTFVGDMVARYGGAGVVEALPGHLVRDARFRATLCARAKGALPLCAAPASAPR